MLKDVAIGYISPKADFNNFNQRRLGDEHGLTSNEDDFQLQTSRNLIKNFFNKLGTSVGVDPDIWAVQAPRAPKSQIVK